VNSVFLAFSTYAKPLHSDGLTYAERLQSVLERTDFRYKSSGSLEPQVITEVD
jgi:hypothetical protein